MTSLRSSVRPKSSKQPWGTILQPDFGLGYQRMTDYEVRQTVDRLSRSPVRQEALHTRPQQADLDGVGVNRMVRGRVVDAIVNVIMIVIAVVNLA